MDHISDSFLNKIDENPDRPGLIIVKKEKDSWETYSGTSGLGPINRMSPLIIFAS